MVSGRIIHVFIGIIMISNCCMAQNQLNYSEVKVTVDAVIDKVILDSNFDLTSKPQKPSETIQSLNFSYQFGGESEWIAYAYSILNCTEEGEYLFGFSNSGITNVWINDQKVFTTEQGNTFWFTEFAYDKYLFPKSFKVFCKKGFNKLLVGVSSSEIWKFYIAPIYVTGNLDKRVQFTLPLEFSSNGKWLICCSYDSIHTNYLETPNLPNVKGSVNQKNIWSVPKIPFIAKVMPSVNSSFKKHSYTEWHYANGSMFWSILNYSIKSENKRYEDFVKQYCNFTIENLEYFKYQYYELGEIHGFNHRISRLHMLDDASAPALPFLSLSNLGYKSNSDFLLKRVENYITNDQVRLIDGTYCRPEPWEATIWADDLFMSAPYLMLLGESSGNNKFYDDAAFQVISFYKHLFDSKVGLCHHGWVDSPKKDSIPYWSRANGWVIWATSEVLLKLPKEHKDYKVILKMYKQHINGLLFHQDREGFIHQIINVPSSFAETSSTAMLTIALARGVNQGWLPMKYRKNAEISWLAVKSRIGNDGVVKGICEGTEVNTELKYYLERKQLDNDPRGLGAVITAGLEICKMVSNN